MATNLCFWLIAALFVLESLWIACTLNFPGIFDEAWHVGIIAVYAQHGWNPLLTSQTPATYQFGQLTHDPSFLYSYLISFPYRLIIHAWHNLLPQIIALRVLNIGFMLAAIVLFRRLLQHIKLPPGLTNAVLLFFVLVPVVPFLAAQVNNDNLLMPFVPLALLLALKVQAAVSRGKLPAGLTLITLTVCMVGCMVHYEFLPVALAVICWLAYRLWRRGNCKELVTSFIVSWQRLSLLRRCLLAVCFAVSLGLFVRTYGQNIVLYHTPVPNCNQVLSTADCLHYYTFQRNYSLLMQHQAVSPNLLSFSVGWLYRMLEYSFYTALNGPQAPLQVLPFPLPVLAALSLAAVGMWGLISHGRELFKQYPALGFLCFVAGIYAVVLWLHNYLDFLSYGAKIGINGRYLFPVLPIIMTTLVLGCRTLVQPYPRVLAGTFVVGLLLFLQGGGALTYIVASDPAWWWPRGPVLQAAWTTKRLSTPFVIRFPLLH